MGLLELRNEINEIDDAMLKLFIRRMEAAKKVANYKLENNIDILNIERENEVIERAKAYVEGDMLKNEVARMMNLLMNSSRALQAEIIESAELEKEKNNRDTQLESKNSIRRVAYQGVDGSNSHEVACAYFSKEDDLLKYSSFKEVFESVENGEADYGILPIENSYTGSINEIYDYLGKSDIKIVGEYIIDIRHNLMAKKGTKIEDIRKVYSHPQGFLQSKKFLSKNKQMEQVSYHNTAISAKYVRDALENDIAAIASNSAAKIYGLEILESNINDQDENKTKFIIVSKDYRDSDENNKITLMFNISHKAGVLHKVLSHLSHNELNISKLESRPIEGKEWEYSFYMDIVGNTKSKKIEYVLKLIENEVIGFKLLGCYKAH